MNLFTQRRMLEESIEKLQKLLGNQKDMLQSIDTLLERKRQLELQHLGWKAELLAKMYFKKEENDADC